MTEEKKKQNNEESNTGAITKDMGVNEILMIKPEAADLLLETGMHCLGCPMAQMETLEQGCFAHGMSEEEIKKLVEKLNRL